MTEEEQEILRELKVNMWEVITKQSGGHKDITNIAGLNLLGKDFQGANYPVFLKQIMADLAEELKDARLS